MKGRLKLILKQDGSSLVGALIAATIVALSFMSYHESIGSYFKNSQKLILKGSQTFIINNLHISALSGLSLERTKNHDSFIKNCMKTEGTCTNTRTDITWYDSTNRAISGDGATYVYYDADGKIVSSCHNLSKECAFRVSSSIQFQCPHSADSCPQADSASVLFKIQAHNSYGRLIKEIVNKEVVIPDVVPDIEIRTMIRYN